MEVVGLAVLRKRGECSSVVGFGCYCLIKDIIQSNYMSGKVGPSYNKENDESEQMVLISSTYLLDMFCVCSLIMQRKHC